MAPIPLLLVAGGFGAGKTTLIARWLADSRFANSAVLVNEPGEAPVDAHLLGPFAGASRTLAGGCACCTARAALSRALAALVEGRPPSLAPFDRVIVELAGLAHPLPLLHDLQADPFLRDRLALHGLVSVVDATRALEGAEARACAAAADVVVLAKAELAEEAAIERLASEIARLNPYAEILRASHGAAQAREAWEAAAAAPARELRHLDAAVDAGAVYDEAQAPATLATVHGAGLATQTVRFAAPVDLSGFCVKLANFLDAHGDAVARMKGLVAARGRRGPAVIQVVGGSLQPVRTLKDWPAGAAPGGLLVVSRGLDAEAVRIALT